MSEDRMKHISSVQEKYTDELMQKAHVVGVGVGLAQEDGQYTNEISIVVMVDKKVPIHELEPEDRIPQELDGVRVDVQETGEFTTY
jgi:hypothetical protein